MASGSRRPTSHTDSWPHETVESDPLFRHRAPQMANDSYPTNASLRRLLDEVLTTEDAFEAFCIDHFPHVSKQFSTQQTLLAKQNLLFQSVDSSSILERLKTYRPQAVEQAEHILAFASRSEISSIKPEEINKKFVDNIAIAAVGALLLVGILTLVIAIFGIGLRVATGSWETSILKTTTGIAIYAVSILMLAIFSTYVESVLKGKQSRVRALLDLDSQNRPPATFVLKTNYRNIIPYTWLRLPVIFVAVVGYFVEIKAIGTGSTSPMIIWTILWIVIGLPISCIAYFMEFIFFKRRSFIWVEKHAEEWNEKLSALIEEKRRLEPSDLVDVPHYAKSVLLQKYAEDHMDEMLYTPNNVLEYRKPKAVGEFLGDLQSLMSKQIAFAIENKMPDISALLDSQTKGTFLDGFKKLTHHLCRSIGASEQLLDTAHKNHRYHCSLINTSYMFEGTRIPDRLPFLLLNGLQFTDGDLDDLRVIINSNITYRTVIIGLLFCDDTVARMAQVRIDNGIRKALACDVIVISKSDVIKIISSDDPQRFLRKFIIQKVDILTVSPFVIVGPTPDNLFFGRESEIRVIAEHARTKSHAVIGGRRVGKSSLLNRLHRTRLPALGFRTAYLDCASATSASSLLAENVKILAWHPTPPESLPETFAELLRAPPTDKAFVLLLDEADKIVPSERQSGWPLFNLLRAMANSGQGQIVLSGERTLRDALRDPKSPLFNFANELLLGPLDYRAVEELITRPMKQLDIELSNEKEIIDHIWNFTSGHPNIVQRLCHRLIERLSKSVVARGRRISMEDVDSIIKDPRFQEEDFLNTYWERSTSLEKIITILLAKKREPRRLQDVLGLLHAENIQVEPGTAKSALDRLVDLRSILKRGQLGYEFSVSAFPTVLASTTTTEDLLLVLKSTYSKEKEEEVCE